jgi:c(7)-type cytochrome triheme protein
MAARSTGLKINRKEEKYLAKGFYKFFLLIVPLVFLVGVGISLAQKKVGGGEFKFEAKGSTGPVLFSHESHVNQHKLKCTDCHTKVFKMKKGQFKMAQANHGEEKHCGVCHNGKKAFGQTKDADCSKCHKK